MKGKDVAFLGIMTALSLCLSFAETLIPVFVAIPGVKIGLANIAVVFILYRLDFKKALIVSLIRVLLSGLLFSNLLTMAYSLAGALVSLVAMALLKKVNIFSPTAVSVCGGVTHNIAQISVAYILLKTPAIKFYIPVLMATGVISGALIGIVASIILNRFDLKDED